MRHHILWTGRSIFLAFTVLLAAVLPTYAAHFVSSQSRQHTYSQQGSADFPTVDPDYIYQQLDYMVTNYQRREAGYDANLPVNVNGHDEFASYWAQEMERNLQGSGAQVRRDPFPIKGWAGHPTTVPAFNVEVSVPGVSHPEQVVVIGCHYDGMAFSTQSANDDASGCAIELGVAKAMGDYWRSHHSYPARTLRFVIFDAEESGLFGSFHYLNETVNGDIQNIVAMFNEEQSGIAYPLRYLGQMKNPVLPLNIDLSPVQNNSLYPNQAGLSAASQQRISHFRDLMGQAIPAVFAQFRAMGYEGLTYHDDNHNDVAQAIFSADQINNVRLEDDTLGSSDQVPFTMAGLPCATLVGNSSYYENNPPAWSYPYDQRADTLQLMNTFASGNANKSNALTLALALPGMITTWMLGQADILGATGTSDPPVGAPIAAISDIGKTVVGQSLAVNANAAFDPLASNSSLSYTWDFGDGSRASGAEVSHTYTTAGTYTLTLTASSATGKTQVRKTINVGIHSTTYKNLYGDFTSDGMPPSNPQVVLPTPDNTLSDKVVRIQTSQTTPATPSTSHLPAAAKGPMIAGSSLIVVCIVIGLLLFLSLAFLLSRRKRL